ncbi:MAG: hypothetical protein AAFV07_14585 [Bacteroidota bacterium]
MNISIPSKKNWFALLFGTVWMAGWTFGFMSAGQMILGDITNGGPENYFLIFWITAWTLGGLAVSTLLLWGILGRERLILSPREVYLSKTILGIGIKKRLQASQVSNFRLNTIPSSWMSGNRWAFWGVGPGRVKFDYGMKTYSLGLACDEAEAAYLVNLLTQKTTLQS